jgi:hypothetical protein
MACTIAVAQQQGVGVDVTHSGNAPLVQAQPPLHISTRPHDWMFPDRSPWQLGRARRRDVFTSRTILYSSPTARKRRSSHKSRVTSTLRVVPCNKPGRLRWPPLNPTKAVPLSAHKGHVSTNDAQPSKTSETSGFQGTKAVRLHRQQGRSPCCSISNHDAACGDGVCSWAQMCPSASSRKHVCGARGEGCSSACLSVSPFHDVLGCCPNEVIIT